MSRRRLSSEDLSILLIDYGQKKKGGQRDREPNDRRCSPKTSQILRRIDPEELDRLLRDDDQLADAV